MWILLLVDEHLAKHLNFDFSSPFFDLKTEDILFIKEIFVRMLTDNNQLPAISYLISLLSAPEAEYRKISDKIIKYKEIIIENYSQNFTIEQYAEKLKITKEILNQLCKDETGLTAKQLQLDLKITEAKRLLLYSSLNTGRFPLNSVLKTSLIFREFLGRRRSIRLQISKKYLKFR